MYLKGYDIYKEILEYSDVNEKHELGEVNFLSVPNLLNDVRSWLQADDYDELRQCIKDFINELEEYE